MGRKRQSIPALVWLFAIGVLLIYEAWAILFGGYEYTLTAPVRRLVDDAPWFAGVLGAFLAWFFVHMVIERRKE